MFFFTFSFTIGYYKILSSLWYAIGACWLSTLYRIACVCQFQTDYVMKYGGQCILFSVMLMMKAHIFWVQNGRGINATWLFGRKPTRMQNAVSAVPGPKSMTTAGLLITADSLMLGDCLRYLGFHISNLDLSWNIILHYTSRYLTGCLRRSTK